MTPVDVSSSSPVDANWTHDERHNHYTYINDSRSLHNDDTNSGSIDYTGDIRPYLQLPHLYSLSWLAYPIISLLFIVFRFQISSQSANDAVANVKADLLASCKAAERAATSTASMPRYLAIATNAQITDAVNGTMHAARATMILALTIMETIINFIIDLYRSTFLCFLELVVRGALSILLGALDEINKLLSTTFSAIRTGIQNDVQGINKVIATAINGVNDVIRFIPGVPQVTPPTIDVPSLDALKNVQLPSDFTDALQKLNNSLPTIADLKDKIEDIVDKPFELLKKDINDTFSGLSFEVDALPLPSQNTVKFCDQMDTSVVDDLARDLVKIVKIGTAILVVLIILLIAANCALEWYKWRAMKAHLILIRDGLRLDPAVTTVQVNGALYARASEHDLMTIEGTIGHPWVSKMTNWMQRRLKIRQSRKDRLIWFFHYVFHPPALACFLIGVFGLLSVELQLLAIGPIQHKYEQQAAASVSNFSSMIATSINASMYNDSATYAGAVNARVDAVQSSINDGLFGWVNGTTTTLNNTISAFYADVQSVVDTVFGNTILEEPVQEFVRCFIGSKVDAFENALTFLHDNLHVDIPRVNNSVLVLSPESVNEATQPIAQAAIGTGNGPGSDDGGLVGRVVNVYVRSLETERIMFAIFIGLWFVVVLMAIGFLLWEQCRPRRGRVRSGAPAGVSFVPSPGAGAGAKMSFEKSTLYDIPLRDEPKPTPTASRPKLALKIPFAVGWPKRMRSNAPAQPSGFDEKSGRYAGDEEQGLPYDGSHEQEQAQNPFSDTHSIEGHAHAYDGYGYQYPTVADSRPAYPTPAHYR